MFDKLNLKCRVYALEIENISRKNRLDIPEDAMRYLLIHHKEMLDRDLVLYIKWMYLKMQILKNECISNEALTSLLYMLDLNKITNVRAEHFNISKHLENASCGLCSKIVIPDHKYNSTFYAFVYKTSDTTQDIFVHNDDVHVNEFD